MGTTAEIQNAYLINDTAIKLLEDFTCKLEHLKGTIAILENKLWTECIVDAERAKSSEDVEQAVYVTSCMSSILLDVMMGYEKEFDEVLEEITKAKM